MSIRLVGILTSIAVSVALAVGLTSAYYLQSRPDGEATLNARALANSRPLEDFTLQYADGDAFTRQDLLGRWTVLSFGFTHCPDVCPTTLAFFRDELRLLEEDDEQAKVTFMFVSVDPQRDLPEKLAAYVHSFDPRIQAVTGGLNELKAFTKQFGAHFAYEGEGDQYQVAHSPQFFLISPEGHWTALYTPPVGRGKVAMDLAKLIH